jgi:hypothetical protein
VGDLSPKIPLPQGSSGRQSFRVGPDARFQPGRLGRRFMTVLECGLFHTFDGDERPGYVASLASVTGPHPISQEELRAAFNPSNGWNVAAIEPDRIQTRYHDDGAPAWFATIKRI